MQEQQNENDFHIKSLQLLDEPFENEALPLPKPPDPESLFDMFPSER